MEQLHADGVARAIGVANFYPDRVVCSGYKWLSSHGGAALFDWTLN
jgi:hypothetical protein